MKVKELIEKLKEYDPEKNVYMIYDGSIYPITEEEISKDQDGDVVFE